MASAADAGTSAIAELFNSLQTSGFCGVAVSTLFIYDSFIIFDREVASFWAAKRWTGASLLFLANKWISLMVYITAMILFAPFPSDEVGASASGFLSTSTESVPWAVFSALRAFVLSRSKLVGLLILALSLAPVGANIVPYGFHLSGLVFPPLGCLQKDSTTDAIQMSARSLEAWGRTVVIVARVPLIIADLALVYITWLKPLRSWEALIDIERTKGLSLSGVLFRNGTVYFVILTILNVLHLAFSATALAIDGNFGASNIVIFTAVITAILTSRFLLALQEANRTVVRVDLDLDRGDRPLHPSAGWGDQYDSAPSFISSLGGFVNPDLAESASWDGDGDEGYGRHGGSCEEEGEETRDSDSVLNEIETMKSV